MIHPIYSYTRAGSSSLTKRRKHEREENKAGVLTWRREARRDPEEGNTIPTGPDHGNAGSTPRVHYQGPEVHRDRIPGHSKSGYQRAGRACLEFINEAATARALRVVVSYYLLARAQAHKLAREQASANS